MVQLFLSCTEIKWYYVEGNSKGVSIVLKCWIDDFVVLGREIPDFRFQITEQNIFKRNKNFLKIYLTLLLYPPIIMVSPLREIEA